MKHVNQTLFLLFFLGFLNLPGSFAQTDGWSRKADFGGSGRDWAFSFVINGKGYIGTGYNGTNILSDFWEYNPTTDTWTRRTNFPTTRSAGIGFAIGNFGYAGGASPYKDFWKYNPATNSWSRQADVPGPERYGRPVGFTIGNFGFAGLGVDTGLQSLRDFWQFDPDSNKWIRKADFPTDFTSSTVAFSIGNKGYVGTGENYSTNTATNQFWEYDPATDTWTQKASVGFDARNAATGLSIGGKGYIGMGLVENTGVTNDWWEYDPVTDQWAPVNPCDVDEYNSYAGVGFSIGNRGYVGTGISKNYVWQKNFYEYSLHTAVQSPSANPAASVYPNPANGAFTIQLSKNIVTCSIYDMNGKLLLEKNKSECNAQGELTYALPPGMYYLRFTDLNEYMGTCKFAVTGTD